MAFTLPYPDMDFTPLDVLTATEMDQIVSNYEAIADEGLAQKVDVESIDLTNKTTTIAQQIKNRAPKNYLRFICKTDGGSAGISDKPTGTSNAAFSVEAMLARDNSLYTPNDYYYHLYGRAGESNRTYYGRVKGTDAAPIWTQMLGDWDRAVKPSNIDYTTKPVWSTIVITEGSSTDLTRQTLRGTNLTLHRGSGGTWASITAGGSNIQMFRQTVRASFSSAITGNIGVGGIAANSTSYVYWTGVANGSYQNKGETHNSGSDTFSDAIVTAGDKDAISIVITGTRMGGSSWSLHAQIQCKGSAQSFFANVECTAQNSAATPTLYLRGANETNIAALYNAIEVLEI